jgi:hypothetical protein
LRKAAQGYALPLHALIDDTGEDAGMATVRALRDIPAMARAVDRIAEGWSWIGQDVRDVVLASLEATATQVDTQRLRAENTPLPRRTPSPNTTD